MTQTHQNLFTTFIKDIFTGWTLKEAIYAWFLIGLQVATYIWNPDSPLGFITGLTGTICVLLVAKRKMSNYVFGFIQTGIALYLGLSVRLWGESVENAFYFTTQIVGYFAWRKHMVSGTNDMEEDEGQQVETRKFTALNWLVTILILALGTAGAGYLFDQMSGTQPYLDAFTMVTAFVAQIIMLARYREQWNFWFLLNIVSLYQWFVLGNMSMVALYVAFIINNAYGYWQWTKGADQ